MPEEIICVYQDCPLCGSRGEKLKGVVRANGVQLKKVSFASPEGKELVHVAVFEKGIKTMPFFARGGDFATSIEALIVKKPKRTRKNVKKTTKKTRKNVKKGADNGVDEQTN